MKQSEFIPTLLFLSLIISLSVGAVEISPDDEEDRAVEQCLVLPYISSFDKFIAKPIDNEGLNHEFYLRFKVDYDYTAEMNLMFSENTLIRSDETKVKISPDEKDRHITYTGANYPDPKVPDSLRYISYTKAEAFKEAKKIYKKLNLDQNKATAKHVAPACSPAYIYDADIIIPPNRESNNKKYHYRYDHWKYHKYMSCRKSIQYTGANGAALISSHNGYRLVAGRLNQPGITAAAFSNRFAIFATADGAIYVDTLDKEFMFYNRTKEPFKLTHKPGPRANNSTGLDSSFCEQELYKVNLEESESSNPYLDIESIKPYRTVTGGFESPNKERHEFIVAEADAIKRLHRYYTYDKSHVRRKRSEWPAQGLFAMKEFVGDKNRPFFVSSMAIFENRGITRCQALFRCPFETTFMYYVNSEIKSDYSMVDSLIKLNSTEMAEPDDITYWSSCERIVSFYGIMYTMHHFKENIFEVASKWGILSEKLFDFPIEAVHAEQDVFYFFVKSTTVYRMTADSSTSCLKLAFKEKTTLHVSEFLGYQPKQFHTEGRYFNGTDWHPKWENYETNQNTAVTTMEPTEQEVITTDDYSEPQPYGRAGESSVWMYVGLSLLGLLILVLTVIGVYLLPQRRQRLRSH